MGLLAGPPTRVRESHFEAGSSESPIWEPKRLKLEIGELPGTVLEAIDRTVCIVASEAGVVVEGPLAVPDVLGLQLNAGLVNRVVDRLYRRARRTARPQDKRKVVFSLAQLSEAQRLVEKLKARMAKIALFPIGQSQVEQLLGITRSECNRWTKNGRIRSSGHLIISRGGSLRIQLPTYSPVTVGNILDQPELIERWRREDHKTQGS
jgi:hypothetical protein